MKYIIVSSYLSNGAQCPFLPYYSKYTGINTEPLLRLIHLNRIWTAFNLSFVMQPSCHGMVICIYRFHFLTFSKQTEQHIDNIWIKCYHFTCSIFYYFIYFWTQNSGGIIYAPILSPETIKAKAYIYRVYGSGPHIPCSVLGDSHHCIHRNQLHWLGLHDFGFPHDRIWQLHLAV